MRKREKEGKRCAELEREKGGKGRKMKENGKIELAGERERREGG